MANPVLTADKSFYRPGEQINISMDYDPRTIVFTGKDQDNLIGTVTVVVGGGTVTAPGKTIVKDTDNGTVATFHTTA